MSGAGSTGSMPSQPFETAVRRLVDKTNLQLGEAIARLRSDAGLSRLRVAGAAGIDDTYLGRIEDGDAHPSTETLARIGLVLGADLSVRLYPNTGPSIRDRVSAPMLELLLPARHPRWQAFTEVNVHRPARGRIDLLLHDPRERIVVAHELQSELRRLEQLIGWQSAKTESLPSWTGWTSLGNTAAISRAMIVRRSRATRRTAAEFARQLRVAYPAHPDDAIEALTGTASWPGAALIWVHVEGGRARFAQGR
jgi:transcriptional regulator with XRE-family HTH domain